MSNVQLFIHQNISTLREHALKSIKGYFSVQSRTEICLCKSCVAINEKRHPALVLIPPKTSYTRESIETLHAITLHKRSAEEPLFCILENPEFLLQAAANSLLKTLEEPPPHITFLFLSQSFLPTITSRSTLFFLEEDAANFHEQTNNLIACIIKTIQGLEKPSGAQFDALLSKKCPDSNESMQILEHIIAQVSQENLSNKHLVLSILYDLRCQPPAPGSSKIFWRTAFLNLYECS